MKTSLKNIVKIIKNFRTINSVLGRGQKSLNIPDTFLNNGIVLSGATGIPFLVSISKKSPELNKKFSDYLSEKTDENFVFLQL